MLGGLMQDVKRNALLGSIKTVRYGWHRCSFLGAPASPPANFQRQFSQFENQLGAFLKQTVERAVGFYTHIAGLASCYIHFIRTRSDSKNYPPSRVGRAAYLPTLSTRRYVLDDSLGFKSSMERRDHFMSALAFDTHAAVKKLQQAGFTEQQAEAQTALLMDVIVGEVATKLDVENVRTELKHDIEAVRLDIENVRTELKHDIEAVRLDIENVQAESKRDIETLRTELKHDIEAVKLDVENVRTELKRDIEAVKLDVENVRAELKRDIETLRAESKRDIETLRVELKRDIETLRTELKQDIAELKRDMKEQEMRLTIKLGAMLVIAISVVATLVKLL